MHDIVKRGSKDFYCTVCRQEWTAPSKAHCPRMPVISYAQRGTLMSQTELGKRGYKNSLSDLPKSTCCYRMLTRRMDDIYVKLYDPAECTLKAPSKRPRLVQWIDSLHWPKAWLPFLEDLSQWRYGHNPGNAEYTREWRQRCLDIVRMASAIHCFTEDELIQLGEGYVVLKFSLTAIRREWEDRGISRRHANDLTELMLFAYRGQRIRLSPSALSVEIDRRIHEAQERRKEAAQRGVWSTDHLAWMPPSPSSPSPAKQQPLF